MKRAFFVPLIALMAAFAFATDVKVGVFVHAPLVQVDAAGKPFGPAIDYIVAVLKEAGYTPVFVVMPLPRIINELQGGTVDMTLEIGKNPEREAFLYYPAKPCYIMKPSLTFAAGNPTTAIKALADLKGLKIGYLSGAALPPFFGDGKTMTFEYVSGETWIKQNLDKLIAGRIDAALDQNAVSYLAEARKGGVANKVKTIPLPGTGTEAFPVFSKKSANGKALLDAYNRVVAGGKYDEAKYIDEFMKK